MLKESKKIVKTVSVFCAIFALFGIVMLLFNARAGNAADTFFLLLLPLTAAAAFLIANLWTDRLKHKQWIYFIISVAALVFGIANTPYSPCNDALDLHTILYRMMNGENTGAGMRTYLDFWINNKLTVYMYIPIVKLAGNVTSGVRFMNGALLVGSVFVLSDAAAAVSEKYRYNALLLLSLFAPFMLMSGPYIYLPVIFFSSVAVRCMVGKGRTAKLVVFLICASVLFILRPTAFGGVMVMFVCKTFFRTENMNGIISALIGIAFALICAAGIRAAAGGIMYVTGLHKYPLMNNAASIWTLELGTRPNGEDTGTCSYSPWNDDEGFDEIQKDFHDLWLCYYNDEYNTTSQYETIKEKQSEIKRLLRARAINMSPIGHISNISHKAANFFKNAGMPYYYRTDISKEKFNLSVNYEKKFFAYMNIILMLFFLASIMNCFAVFAGKDNSDGAAAAAAISVIAVIAVFVLLTEVSKKYIFDVYPQIALSVACIFSRRIKAAPRRIGAAVLALCAVSFAAAEGSCRTELFRNVKAEVIPGEDTGILKLEFAKPCKERYVISSEAGGVTELYGKSGAEITFKNNELDAFILIEPDGTERRFSSKIIW